MKIKTKIISCDTADSKPVKQEVNGTVILPPLVFPALMVVGQDSLGDVYTGNHAVHFDTVTENENY